jgi:hypothetical protein
LTVTLLMALTSPFAGQDNANPVAKQFALGINVGGQTTRAITTDPRSCTLFTFV